MKANVLLPSLLALTALSACAPKTAPPAPPPRAPESPAPPPITVPRPAGDWRDAPLTPGSWTWNSPAGHSTASFALAGQPPLVQIACLARGTVQITHAGTVSSAAPLSITTSAGTFPLMSDPVIPGASATAVTLSARAPVLDAMAYSRGRFVIEVTGLAPSYLPSWPEVSRVVEDCR